MKAESKYISSLVLRYLILVLIAIPGLGLFYFIFLPLTKYPVVLFFDVFYKNVLVIGNSILIGARVLSIISACVGGAAYYLLLILNLSTPKIKIWKRVKMIIIAFLSFLILNILRIILLGIIFINGSLYFELVHKLLWYFGSTILVVGIWFFEVIWFKVKDIPFYSDIKGLYSKSSLKTTSKSRR